MFFQRKGSGKAKPTHERVFGSWKIIRLLAEEPPVKIYEIEKSESGVIEKAALKVVALPADEAMLQEFRNTLSLVSELRDSNHKRSFSKVLLS